MVKNIRIIIIRPYQVKDWGPTNHPQMTTDHHGWPRMPTDDHGRPPPRM